MVTCTFPGERDGRFGDVLLFLYSGGDDEEGRRGCLCCPWVLEDEVDVVDEGEDNEPDGEKTQDFSGNWFNSVISLLLPFTIENSSS